MKYISAFLISLIKIYKYTISPYLLSSCRYMPTCSEYFIESLKIHGCIKVSLLGFKRISKCHPVKFLGGKSGFDPVPQAKKERLK